MVFTITNHVRVKPDAVDSMKNKLIEASKAYAPDKGTLSWLVMQSVQDPREFAVVERYEDEKSLEVHRANPFYGPFFKFIEPLVDGGLNTRHYEEL